MQEGARPLGVSTLVVAAASGGGEDAGVEHRLRHRLQHLRITARREHLSRCDLAEQGESTTPAHAFEPFTRSGAACADASHASHQLAFDVISIAARTTQREMHDSHAALLQRASVLAHAIARSTRLSNFHQSIGCLQRVQKRATRWQGRELGEAKRRGHSGHLRLFGLQAEDVPCDVRPKFLASHDVALLARRAFDQRAVLRRESATRLEVRPYAAVVLVPEEFGHG